MGVACYRRATRAVHLLVLFVLASGALGARAGTRLVIRGSNTFGEELGRALVTAFREQHPEMEVDLESKGSATGFAALLRGECDIATSSRVANEDELRLARSRGLRLNPYLIGHYGVAVIVAATNAVVALSDAQVRDIFTGATTDWRAVGGRAAPIRTYIRDPVSGTYLGFQELAMERRPYARSATPLRSYAAIAEAVRCDADGIGYVGMNVAQFPGVRAVAVNDVRISPLAVDEGRYPYARSLQCYTVADKESAAARRFISFVLSQPGQAVLEQLGFVQRPERRLWSPTEPW
jgi:phosphate transport system substrate-binding protein